MAALTAPRLPQRRDGRYYNFPVAAAAVILQSAAVVLAAGFARAARAGQGADDFAKAGDAATYVCVGLCSTGVTGGAQDGDVWVNIEAGEFNFANSAAADAITRADIGNPCYLVDDQTVGRTPAGGTRAIAGIVADVDSQGVWVDVGPQNARLSGRVIHLPFAINETDLLAATSAELVSPVAGVITRLTTTVQKAVTTGGDVTVEVDGTAVDGLTVAVADAAAKGTVQTDTPTAGHATTAVAPGDRIEVVPAAAFNTAGAVSGFVEIAY